VSLPSTLVHRARGQRDVQGSANGYSFDVARSDGRAIEAVSQRRIGRCGRVGLSVHRVHDAGQSCGIVPSRVTGRRIFASDRAFTLRIE
jgi:hypothetical protein